MSDTVILILYLAALMACGLLLTRFLSLLKLPNVTAYLIAGLILSPFSFGIISEEVITKLSFLSTLALGFIAFSIGFCFKLDHLKELGSKIYTITIVQALSTALIVDLAMLALHFIAPDKIALAEVFVLGAIATATAPAATLLVVKQYKAKGTVTDTLLPVVAIDDAVGLIIFSISFSISKVLANGTALTFSSTVLSPLREIGLSLLIGAAIGFALSFATRFFRSRANRVTLIIICVFLGVGISEWLDLSSLLLCMMIGAIYCNAVKETDRVMEVYDRWTHPLYVIFFVLSGAELNVRMILSVGIVGIVYFAFRSLGKYFGARVGATLAHAEPNVKKYLGITLLPQAGVAIGMSAVVMSAMPEFGESIRTVVLCATLVYELIGPLLTKLALTKAGEIQTAPKKTESPSN